MYWEGHSITSVIFLPKVHSLNVTTRKHQTKLKWASLQHDWLLVLKNVKTEKQREAEEWSKLKETEETWWLTTSYPESDPGQGKIKLYKGDYWDNWEKLNIDGGLRNSIVIIVKFLMLGKYLLETFRGKGTWCLQLISQMVERERAQIWQN